MDIPLVIAGSKWKAHQLRAIKPAPLRLHARVRPAPARQPNEFLPG
jgi:hypothetical protein